MCGMKISVLLLCLGCLATFTAAPYAPIGSSAEQISAGEAKDSLLLSTSIVSQKYCQGDMDLDSLRLVLSLNFTNVGRKSLILYKGSSLVSRLMISRDLKELAERRFEVNSSLTQVTDESSEKISGPEPNELFITLPPGASYKTEATISIFVVRGRGSKIPGAVPAGDHVLQIEVPTWPASNDLAKTLRNLWQSSGCLWYEPMTSSPMEFKVESERDVVDCT